MSKCYFVDINRELRQGAPSEALLNICFCLIAIYLIFTTGNNQVSNHQMCDAMTFLLHYSILACFSWMTLNACQLYQSLTEVIGSLQGWKNYLFLL